MDVPLEFIFDSEAILEKCHDQKAKNLSGGDQGSKTQSVNVHTPSGYCCRPIFKYPDDEISKHFSRHVTFSGKDCSGDFIKSIYESTKFYFENVTMNKPITTTEDDWEAFDEAEECHICGEEFDKSIQLTEEERDYFSSEREDNPEFESKRAYINKYLKVKELTWKWRRATKKGEKCYDREIDEEVDVEELNKVLEYLKHDDAEFVEVTSQWYGRECELTNTVEPSLSQKKCELEKYLKQKIKKTAHVYWDATNYEIIDLRKTNEEKLKELYEVADEAMFKMVFDNLKVKDHCHYTETIAVQLMPNATSLTKQPSLFR